MRSPLTIWLCDILRQRYQRRIDTAPGIRIGGEEDPYMLRWFIIPRNPWFNIYLHSFKRSDDDRALHNHPWWSLSFMLIGSMREIYLADDGNHRYKSIRAGDVTLRSPEFAHRIIIDQSVGDVVTLFITGPRLREWGFLCPNGWRHWRDFTAVRDTGDSTVIGRGCD